MAHKLMASIVYILVIYQMNVFGGFFVSFVGSWTTRTIPHNGCKHPGNIERQAIFMRSQAPFHSLITASVLFQWSLTTSIELLRTQQCCFVPGNGKSERVTTHFFFPLFASIICGGSGESVKGAYRKRSRWSGKVWPSHLQHGPFSAESHLFKTGSLA